MSEPDETTTTEVSTWGACKAQLREYYAKYRSWGAWQNLMAMIPAGLATYGTMHVHWEKWLPEITTVQKHIAHAMGQVPGVGEAAAATASSDAITATAVIGATMATAAGSYLTSTGSLGQLRRLWRDREFRATEKPSLIVRGTLGAAVVLLTVGGALAGGATAGTLAFVGGLAALGAIGTTLNIEFPMRGISDALRARKRLQRDAEREQERAHLMAEIVEERTKCSMLAHQWKMSERIRRFLTKANTESSSYGKTNDGDSSIRTVGIHLPYAAEPIIMTKRQFDERTRMLRSWQEKRKSTGTITRRQFDERTKALQDWRKAQNQASGNDRKTEMPANAKAHAKGNEVPTGRSGPLTITLTPYRQRSNDTLDR